jgi:hypothetical protein
MEETFYVSYMRGATYLDGTKDAKIIIDEEKKAENLEDLKSQIENNQKFLWSREDDVIDFNKDLDSTNFEYLVKDNSNNVLLFEGFRKDIIMSFLVDDPDSFFKALYEKDKNSVYPDASEISYYKLLIAELAKNLNIPESDFSYFMGYDGESYMLRCTLDIPFYSFNKFFLEFSKKYNLVLSVYNINNDVELYQSYSYGNIDEGMIDGECNWQYLYDDYISYLLELLKEKE